MKKSITSKIIAFAAAAAMIMSMGAAVFGASYIGENTAISKALKNAGGNYYTNIIASNSKNFAIGVITDTLNGYETYKDAINLLDIKSVIAFNRTVKELGIK